MADEDQGVSDPGENESNEATPEPESPDPPPETPSEEGAAAEDALDAAQDAVSELSDQVEDASADDAAQDPAKVSAEDPQNEPEESANTPEEEAALAAVMAAIRISEGGEPEPPPQSTELDNDAISAMMAGLQADGEPASGATPAGANPPAGTSAFEMPDLSGAAPADGRIAIDLISDVNLNVKIELGRTRMLVDDVLRLSEGAVVELEKLAGDPVDIYVNDRPVARGEVLVLNDNFCVRVNEILENTAENAERFG